MANDRYLRNQQLAYDLLKKEGYTDIGNSAQELFSNKANSEIAYKLLSQAGYTDIGKDYNEFASMLYAPETEAEPAVDPYATSTLADAPGRAKRYLRREEKAQANRPIESDTSVAEPEPVVDPYETSSLNNAPRDTKEYLKKAANNPYMGLTPEALSAESVRMDEADAEFAREYEQRLAALAENEGTDIAPAIDQENAQWLKENKARYDAYKENKAKVGDAIFNSSDIRETLRENKEAETRAKEHVSAPNVVAGRRTPVNDEETKNWDAVRQLSHLTDRESKLGDKSEFSGKIGEDIVTGVKQFAKAFGGSIDIDTITAGLASASALIDARRIGEKMNGIIDEAEKNGTSVEEALANGLSESEKEVLMALERYTRIMAIKSLTASSAAKGGQGAEQSAEFMLDFLLTGGLEKLGAKGLVKLAARSVRPSKVVRALEKGAVDAGVAAARTALMFPRNLKAYGEQLTQIEDIDDSGRISFSRSKANAALNTALTQYIEYWSEGFGKYFGAAEQALFKGVTRKAPKTAIGRTLSEYRGSIGRYLDNGKFDGMFNEMLEEVVGSSFNALAGALSGNRVGDKAAWREFWAADNLSTLFLSFLPMTAISTHTNLRAYQKMKDRYDQSVSVLQPLLNEGKISEDDLNGLVDNLENKTPEQLKDDIFAIADKARKNNDGTLPGDFVQSLLGFVEGTLSMRLESDAWRNSQQKASVAASYTNAYNDADPTNAWDAKRAEQVTMDAVLQAGFDAEDLDQDPYRLAEAAMALQETDPERSAVLSAYANAKAQNMGLKEGYDAQTEAMNEEYASKVRQNLDVNGNVTSAVLDGQLVFIKSDDVTVAPDGTVSAGSGNGVVEYTSADGSVKDTAKASQLQDAQVQDTESYIAGNAEAFSAQRQELWNEMENTVSPAGMAEMIGEKVGDTVYLRDGQGVYEPLEITRMTDNGRRVVIKASKDVLDGISAALGITAPRGTQLEVDTIRLYPMLATDESGALVSEAPEGETQEAQPAQAPEAPAQPTSQINADDYLGTAVTIPINGTPTEVYVTEVGDNRVEYEYTDANGETRPGSMSIADFQNAIQSAEAPVAEAETPAEETPATQSALPYTKDGEVDWDNMFNVDKDTFAQRLPELIALMQELYKDKAMDFAMSWYSTEKKALDKAKEITGNPKKDAQNARKRVASQQLVDNYSTLITSMRPKTEKKTTPTPQEETPAEAPETDVPDISNDTPEAAQKRGYVVQNGHRIDRSEPDAVVAEGADTSISFTKNKDGVVDAKYALMDVDRLVPSHIADQENPLHFFARDWQPKDRTRLDSAGAIELMAKNLRPAEITTGTNAYTGAPIVNSRGEVIQGNGRGEALRRAYATYKDTSGASYKQYLKDNASQFGLIAEQVDAMENPVLVRVVDVDDATAEKLGQWTQGDLESAGNNTFSSSNLIKRLGENLGDLVDILFGGDLGPDATMLTYIDANGHLALQWLRDNNYINDTEFTNAEENGKLTLETREEFKKLCRAPLLESGSQKVKEGFDKLPEFAKLALDRSLGALNRIKDVIADLKDALSYLYDFEQDPAFKSATTAEEAWKAVEDRMRQMTMEGKTEEDLHPSIVARRLAVLLKVGTKPQKSETKANALANLLRRVAASLDETALLNRAEDRLEAYRNEGIITEEEENRLRNGEQDNNERSTDDGAGVPGEQRGRGSEGDTGSGEETPAGTGENTPGAVGETEGAEGGEVAEAGSKSSNNGEYGSSNKVVTKDQYEGLKRRMREKLGQLNAGFDPEVFSIGVQMAAYHIEAGARKFIDFAKRMMADLGDAIRPYLKAIYNGARDLPGMEDLKGEMDSAATVDGIDISSIDINDISNEQTDDSNVRQDDGGVSEPVGDTAGEQGVLFGTDEGDTEGDSGAGGTEVGTVGGERDNGTDTGSDNEGADATPGSSRRRRGGTNVGGATAEGGERHRTPGRRKSGAGEGAGRDTGRVEESEEEKEARAQAQENAAYEAEKERIKDESDTKKLKALKDEIKAKLSSITDKYDAVRAQLSGQLRAVLERLQQLFSSNLTKSQALEQEKVPYSPVSDPTEMHSIGSVVPSGSADYMRDALKRLEAEVGKSVADFVKDELGYTSLDEMFTSDGKSIGLSAEQVDAVALAIHQIKTGRIFIVGDMTGVGKGRVGAALIRWGKRNKKKVIFCTEQPNLFTAMNDDLRDIGTTGLVPFIINDKAESNITDEDGNIIVRHSSNEQRTQLFKSGKDTLPDIPGVKNKGKKYDYVMTTYSQLQASEEESEGESEKAQNLNSRNKKGRERLQWLKTYAKDAVVIMDESHTAAGAGSTRGENAMKLVEAAQGVMFMSATFAKNPTAMGLYAIRSSMNEAQITRDQLIAAIAKYGIPMQEILSATLYKTGEYIRRERDFTGVKTNWEQPEDIYSNEEIETTRNLSDKTSAVINQIIEFQRRYVDPIIRKKNSDLNSSNEEKKKQLMMGAVDSIQIEEYASTPYAGQVSNVISMMLFAIKAKKAAEMAIEQIKKGDKPVIAVDNTLGAYVDSIEGNIDSADFGAILQKGLAFALKYQKTTKTYKMRMNGDTPVIYEVADDRKVEKYDSIEGLLSSTAITEKEELEQDIVKYGVETLAMDLPLSPIDYIKKKIEDAGYKCGEITKRANALVQNADGTWKKVPLKHNKKDVIRRFNGGSVNAPIPKEERYDAVIMNRSGATGNSMHASARFGDQSPRKMIILQAAKDPNNEVQIRGRIDRTGQVHRGEYFYIISPIPAEKKIVMMLKQKLASLDATSVGTENVSSNRVEAADMDNKYGDEVARDFLSDHKEILLQMDAAKQPKTDKKTGELKTREGLLYDLLISMQRMTCAEQELILKELEESYAQKIEYLNQNGINDLATTTMNLEATTIDKAIMIKGKDDESMSEFAHDTIIERVETNVLRKPLRSADVEKKITEYGARKEDGTIDPEYGDKVISKLTEYVNAALDKKLQKNAEAEKALEDDIRTEIPRQEGQTEEEYDEAIANDPRLVTLKTRDEAEYDRLAGSLADQRRKVATATRGFKPGRVYLVPLNEDEHSQSMYGRFLGFKMNKDGKPKGVEAVFATKDSRAMVSIPVVNMYKLIDRMYQQSAGWYDIFGKTEHDYSSEQERIKAYDEWWDKKIPANTARAIRYMITGNILQAASNLMAYRGTITTFTRKDPETGEITIDKGLLLAEDFDPENFMVRTAVTKQEVWENAGEFNDTDRHISVYRDGDNLVVKFYRPRGSKEKLAKHPVLQDEAFKALCIDNRIDLYSQDELHAEVTEANAEAMLDYLYNNYGFTQGHLLVLPDSTEKPDRIVYSGKSYEDVINELKPKYRVYGADDAQSKIDDLLKTYRMDINDEDVKTKIRELVQLRQAFLRNTHAQLDEGDLAWRGIIYEQHEQELSKPKPTETPEEAKDRKQRREEAHNMAEALREELSMRGFKKGHMKHFKQGAVDLDTIEKTFNEFNSDPENAEIAKKVFAIARQLNLKVFMDEKVGNEVGGQTAGDMVSYNWRFMNEDWIPDQLKANTILHELVHTATVYAIRAVDNGADHLIPGIADAAQQANTLYSAIRRNKAFRHQVGNDSWNYYTDYGASKNSKELLAETGSNQKFRDDLAKVKVLIQKVSSFGDVSYSFQDVTDEDNPQGRVISALDAAKDILQRLLDGFNKDAYTKMWAGTGYGDVSYQSLNEAEEELIPKTLDTMSKELGIKINRVSRDEMPKGHSRDKGYYNPQTGEMTICMENITDERDAVATVLHETVAHHGLRKLFGDRFNDAMVRIYAALDSKGRAWVASYMRRHNLAPGNGGIIRGMEEYLAHLAEGGDFKNVVWQRIREIFGRIVDALFGTKGFQLTNNELNYILRASYEHLKNPNWMNTIEGKAFDTLLKRQLGINETDPNRPTDPDGPGTGNLYRDGDTGAANTDYDSAMKDFWTKVVMNHQNADLPIKIGMEKIMKEVGKTKLDESEDYLTRHNLSSSRAESQAHEFELFRFKPMLEQVRAIQSKLLGKKSNADQRAEAYERILDYLYAVSGIERTEYKNNEIEQQKQEALEAARADAQAKVEDMRSDGAVNEQINRVYEKLAAKEKKIEDTYEATKKDWAGLTSLMGRPSEEWREALEDAKALVESFRDKVGDDAALDELWDRIRSCTDFSLEHAYRHGLLTREEYERLHGTASQPRMWNYYLPLRGFSAETAEDEYNYSNLVHPKSNSVVVKKMNGRWTQADNPLANILNIAETEIVQGNENWAKQALYRFVLGAGKNTLLAQRDAWFEKNPADGTWSLAQPRDNESLEEFEARMQELHDMPDGPLAKKGRQNLKLDKIMANRGHQNEHLIRLKVGGMDKMIWVNGNPALAKAVTGLDRADNYKTIRRASRALSNLFTTYSLDFTARNLFRDTIYSRLALIAKEDNAYRQQFRKNWWSNFGYGAFAFPMVKLMSEWESGKLQTKPNLTPKEQMFLDFMRDGGQTGYTIINTVSEIKKELERSMRKAGQKVSSVNIPILGHLANAIKVLNEGFELLTRFTAYQTSRDMGRSGQRSASDAKEISVNFNRKGAQTSGLAAYLGATHYFYNAGVQGFDNFLRLFKVAPAKMTTATGSLVVLAMVMPLLNSMLAGLAAGAGNGDDDDDWYWNLPEWVRRNNLVLGTGSWYVAIPLAVELRAFYGLGDIAASLMYHKAPARDGFRVGLDVINTAGGILPINPIEGFSGSNPNIGDAILRTVAPDAGMFIVDIATNRDYTGRPLWKENPFSGTAPKSQSAYASTPKGLVEACQALAKATNGGIDLAPGAVRDVFKNLGGGFYKLAEDASKLLYADEERPRRWDDVPFFSGFTGHIDEDRSNSFATNALYGYKNISDDVVRRINIAAGTSDITAAMVYDNPEQLPKEAKVQKVLEGEDYVLGKMYRDGMKNEYKMKQRVRNTKYGNKGDWYKSKEVERYGVETLKKNYRDLREQWASMPDGTDDERAAKKAFYDLSVQNAWHEYYNAEADLVDRLMEEEYNHVEAKRKNGIPYEPKPTTSERVYNWAKDLVE